VISAIAIGVTRSPTRRIKGRIPERVSAQASELGSRDANGLIALTGIGEQSTRQKKAINRTSLASRSEKHLFNRNRCLI
jgi:hypothetical protein